MSSQKKTGKKLREFVNERESMMNTVIKNTSKNGFKFGTHDSKCYGIYSVIRDNHKEIKKGKKIYFKRPKIKSTL
jgi:hypothetical protein